MHNTIIVKYHTFGDTFPEYLPVYRVTPGILEEMVAVSSPVLQRLHRSNAREKFKWILWSLSYALKGLWIPERSASNCLSFYGKY